MGYTLRLRVALALISPIFFRISQKKDRSLFIAMDLGYEGLMSPDNFNITTDDFRYSPRCMLYLDLGCVV